MRIGGWRRLCIKFVGVVMIERVIHGNRSHIYRDMLAWWKFSRNHMKKMLRDWLLTVGVRQNQKKHMLSKTLPSILSCTWRVLPLQCGLWAYFRWWLGIPDSVWNEPNRVRRAILQFGMQHLQCQDVDLWSNIRTLPIWRITMSQLGLPSVVKQDGEGITSRCCGTPYERLQFPNIILNDRIRRYLVFIVLFWVFFMRARYSCKAPSILHPILWCLSFIRWSAFEKPKITYVHTTQRETISIHEALEKDVTSEKIKLILKAKTQMVEIIYKYFDLTCQNLIDPSCISSRYWTQGSRSSTTGQHVSTLTIHNCGESHVVVWDYMTWRLTCCVLYSQIRLQLGIVTVTWTVDQEFQNFCGWRRW